VQMCSVLRRLCYEFCPYSSGNSGERVFVRMWVRTNDDAAVDSRRKIYRTDVVERVLEWLPLDGAYQALAAAAFSGLKPSNDSNTSIKPGTVASRAQSRWSSQYI